ncbi:MAG: hypothetical protein FWD31_03790, partial [Planctomycetaceae bacterium]|nr:hypothetical protein [Planctomycetaceae bacterium]
MSKRQYATLLLGLIFGISLSSIARGQEITGPSVTAIGRQAVFEITDVTSADWGVSDGCDLYVDSTTLRVIVTPYSRGTMTLHAAVVLDGKPKLSLWHFDVTGTDYDRDNDKDNTPRPDPIPIPMTLAEWVRINKPASLSDSQMITLAGAFSTTVKNIESGAIRTVDSAYNSVRTTTTPFFVNNAEVKSFLTGVSERTQGQELQELSNS